jgi:tetratricopeptide (TPR) repeat protein
LRKRPLRSAFTTMALPRRNPLLLLAVGLAFALALAVFTALDPATRDPRPATPDANERALQADRYVQKAAATGDPSYYARAEDALRSAPRNAAVLTALGTLSLARHDFRAGLDYGRAAHQVAPAVVKPLGVIVDAQVELGRYGAASRTLQQMVTAKPTVSSYSRVSYFRELHGDLRGAVRAMRLAVSAAGSAGGDGANVQSLLGGLEFARGRLAAAAAAYRQVLYRLPGYPAAAAGLAEVEAARGRHGAAIRRLRGVVNRVPLPQYSLALAELELAAGRRARARADLALAAATMRRFRSNGENIDTELALFEADHGSPRRAVALGRSAWRRAPSVRAAHALGWALTRAGRPHEGLAWARRALKLGSRDPVFLYHAGIAALRAGDSPSARRWLRAALSQNPRFSPLLAPRARRALKRL